MRNISYNTFVQFLQIDLGFSMLAGSPKHLENPLSADLDFALYISGFDDYWRLSTH